MEKYKKVVRNLKVWFYAAVTIALILGICCGYLVSAGVMQPLILASSIPLCIVIAFVIAFYPAAVSKWLVFLVVNLLDEIDNFLPIGDKNTSYVYVDSANLEKGNTALAIKLPDNKMTFIRLCYFELEDMPKGSVFKLDGGHIIRIT